MEAVQFDAFQKDQETLDFSSSRVSDWESNLSRHQVPLEGNKNSEDGLSLVDSVLCDSGPRLISSGFVRSNCTGEIVMFVNAGGEAMAEEDSGMNFHGDLFYEGGSDLRTEEYISEGGDYPVLYQSARLGNFSYRFLSLPSGDYFIDLHFAEIINTNGPKGMRVFEVFVQDCKVLAEFDIFSIVGANKPLQVVDLRVNLKEEGEIVIRFEGVHGSPVVSGICIRKAPKQTSFPEKHEYLECNNCAAEIQVSSTQMKFMQTQSTDKYEKKIDELTMQCQLKTDECYQALMSLTAANEELQQIRLELGDKLLQTCSLDQTVGKQEETLRSISTRYEHDKKLWTAAVKNLEEKIKILKGEYSQLACEAHECAGSIPELNKMVSAVQALVAQCEDLKVKYSEEQAKRKMLFNQVQEAKGNIRVFCRCRPLNSGEMSSGSATIVDFDAAKDGDIGIQTGGCSKKIFRFDQVYTPKDDQVDVFADASPMVISVLDGYNVCIFAYGQTGTGKTFTMEGTEQNRGVNYRTLEQLFLIAKKRCETFKYNIFVSVLEVYNEQIRDLLGASPTSKRLEIKQASEGFNHLPGIVEARVNNIGEVWKLLQAGSNARAIGSNNVNEHSSRSHCMLCIMVKAKNLMNGECTRSKLWLVDLAGSERLAKTDAQGERLKEAQNINRSLSALGDVISALASKSSHIPYRNSKLTHLLQDSLGGDSKTLMFVQISPSERDLSETVGSLNFATRVRGIELAPAKKQVDTGELQKMKVMLDKARQECRFKDESLKELGETLQNFENKNRGKDQIHKNQQEKIKELESQLELRTTLYSQSEKQLSQLSDSLQSKEEFCNSLQQKVKDLENRLHDRDRSEFTMSQQKVRELENQLREKIQQSESNSHILQQKVKELEGRLKEHDDNSVSLLHQKIKELEDILIWEQQQQRKLDNKVTPSCPDKSRTTPEAAKVMSRDEYVSDIEPHILRSSNPTSHSANNGDTAAKGTGYSLHQSRRKREFSIGGIENNMNPPPLTDKKIRRSDPPRPTGRLSRTTTKPVSTALQRPTPHTRINRDQVQGVKDNKKKIWNR